MNLNGRVVKREIKVPLSKEELDRRRDEAAEAQHLKDQLDKELENLVKEHKEAKSKLDDAIAVHERNIAALLRQIKEKTEMSTQDVREVKNLERGVVEYWYPPESNDSKIVEERPMIHEADKQAEMTLEEKAAAVPAEGDDPSEDENAD